MPSLVRFLCILAVLGGCCYGVMLALVSYVEPTPREFVVTIPQERLARKPAATTQTRRIQAASGQDLQAVEPDRLANALERLRVSR